MRRTRTIAALAAALLVPAVAPGVAGAKQRDRDHDGMPDRWEAKFHLNRFQNDARRDRDHDGLRNLAEFRAGTNPTRRDSDRDGHSDGEEHAGTVLSFADGVLSIALPDGTAMTGAVDARTEIECPATATAASSGGDDSGPGSTSSGSGDDSGDDHGGSGEVEPGDDHGADSPSTSSTAPADTTHDVGDDHGDHDANDDDANDDANDDDHGSCGPDALVAGAPVHEATLRLTSSGRVFKKVELGAAPASTPTGGGTQ